MPRPRGLNRREQRRRKALALRLVYEGVPAPAAARLARMDARTVRRIAALVLEASAA